MDVEVEKEMDVEMEKMHSLWRCIRVYVSTYVYGGHKKEMASPDWLGVCMLGEGKGGEDGIAVALWVSWIKMEMDVEMTPAAGICVEFSMTHENTQVPIQK